jgi:PhoH-like ATPase
MDGTPLPRAAAGSERSSSTSNSNGRNGSHQADPPSSPLDAATRQRILDHLQSKVDVKHFVLDTNVLLHNPSAIFLLADNEIHIPFDVIEELDKFKTNSDDLGRNARTVIRHLDRLREAGNLSEGVPVPETGGVVRVVLPRVQPLAGGLSFDTPDNRIISVAFQLHREGKRVVFISKDINARIKSDALGIPTEDFEAQKVDFDKLYTGWRELRVSAEAINRLFAEKQLVLENVDPPLIANEFVLLRDEQDESHTALARFKADLGAIQPVRPRRSPTFSLLPRNLQQTMALDLLLDDSVRLVSLIGSAGTGKTLLALAAGMSKTIKDQLYQKLLVARPIMPLGRDIGYLPGDKDEKLTAWMQPIFDNMSYLLSNKLSSEGNGDAHHQHASLQSVEQRIKQLMETGQVVLEPLTYIRGRSIPHQFMIIDESQNLTPHEVKTIASRVGEGTKLVLTGDASQIDNPYLDSSSNGLSYLVERLKGKGLVGHVTLAKSERSELASLVTAEL